MADFIEMKIQSETHIRYVSILTSEFHISHSSSFAFSQEQKWLPGKEVAAADGLPQLPEIDQGS